MPNVRIAQVSSYLPDRVVTNEEIEQQVNVEKQLLPPGILEKLFRNRERRFAARDVQTSDLAANAARPIVEQFGAERIEYLIFAGACSDLIEPATANIVQHKLGLRCPAFDLKNACNSFVDAITVANSFIQTGVCGNVLIVTGEKLSDGVRLDGNHTAAHLAAFSLGDAGAAMLLTLSDNESGIHFQKKLTRGQHWQLCTIKGGGSMFPQEPHMNYFEGSTSELKSVILEEGVAFVKACYEESGWSADMIDHLFTHQVSGGTFRVVEQATGIPVERITSVFEKSGNTAAASIPLAICDALKAGRLKRGDKVMLFGIAAGASLSIQFLTW
ncbi:MAG: ketoacyl-ACP synthase III [Saprospiraceae bacterium]|nr:ketoacyl-ACP synthase III [Saprospiraceae bacterium]